MKKLCNSTKPILIFGAHQDDLEIAVGGLIHRLISSGEKVKVVCTTNGAPTNPIYYPRFGISDSLNYSNMRVRESLKAHSFLGLSKNDSIFLNFSDQALAENIFEGVETISSILSDVKPGIIITPAYEGGHPDHDATRFIVEKAIKKTGLYSDNWEYTEYNRFNQKINLFDFLEGDFEDIFLTRDEQSIKLKAFNSFQSQMKYIQPFLSSQIMVREQLRKWRKEDFSSFPHERPLHYETVNVLVDPEKVIQNFKNYEGKR